MVPNLRLPFSTPRGWGVRETSEGSPSVPTCQFGRGEPEVVRKRDTCARLERHYYGVQRFYYLRTICELELPVLRVPCGQSQITHSIPCQYHILTVISQYTHRARSC